jgi:hypothetical protein
MTRAAIRSQRCFDRPAACRAASARNRRFAMKTLVRLIYVSRMAAGLGHKQLNAIIETSRRKNEKQGITGALCYSARGFLQCLEGPSEAINELYGHIVRDKRHVDVTLLSYADIAQRSFTRWAMAYVRADEVDTLILRKYSPGNTFDPFALGAQQALGFLEAMIAAREAELTK